uniref:Fe-S_biosyn domain-containing protein n=1 Tax=Steinernema glaseri TaxID=37863 RepID=A0A1I7Y952_9BILA
MSIEDSSRISRNLLSLRLPVDTVDLYIRKEESLLAVEQFLESTGPLYSMNISCRNCVVKQSTVDSLIEKFLPVDGSRFTVGGNIHLAKEQLERLILKCELSDKKMEIEVSPEGSTDSSKVTDFFDFDKYYPRKAVQVRKVTATREGAKSEVLVEFLTDAYIRWEWK